MTIRSQDTKCPKHDTVLVGPICCPSCSDCFLEFLDTQREAKPYEDYVKTQAEMDHDAIVVGQRAWAVARQNEKSSEG